MNGKIKFFELDALRGLAAIGVMLFHYGAHYNTQPFAFLLKPIYSTALYRTDFLFIISGFVLTHAYLLPFRRNKIAENIVKRLARIYPLHIITLLIVAIEQTIIRNILHAPSFIYIYNDWIHFFLNIGLLSSLGIQKGFSFNGPCWAISTLFYVNLLFFFVIGISKRPIIISSFLTFFSFLLLFTKDGQLVNDGNIYIFDAHLVRTIFDFFTGVLTYMLYTYFENKGTKNSGLCDLTFLSICGLMLFNASKNFGDVRCLDFIIVLVFLPLLIISAIKGKIITAFLNNIVFRSLGKLSYSIYLTHFPVQLLFHIFVLAGFNLIKFENPIVLLFYSLVTIIFSCISYNFIEKPLQNYLIDIVDKRI